MKIITLEISVLFFSVHTNASYIAFNYTSGTVNSKMLPKNFFIFTPVSEQLAIYKLYVHGSMLMDSSGKRDGNLDNSESERALKCLFREGRELGRVA